MISKENRTLNLADQSMFSEDDCVKVFNTIQKENEQFQEYLDKTQNKLTSDVSEFIFASEDPHARLKELQKTLKDLEKIVEMDNLMVGLIEKR